MSKITLIQSNPEEGRDHSQRLQHAGHQFELYTSQSGGMPALRAIRDNPPDIFVIDLGRQPSQGREIAIWLRRQRATRHVPIVFVDGEPEKVAGVRKLLPDAVYTE